MKRPNLGDARATALRAATLALLACTPAWASPLPVGITITGSVSGASSELLGLDSGYASGPSSHITGLSDVDVEYLTGDFALAIDFGSDGLLRVYNNSGSDLLPGNYSFTFDFAGLPDALSGVALRDVSAVSGSLRATRLNGRSIQLTLDGVGIAGPFGSFTAQISTVPEPATLLLALAALGLMAGIGRRAGALQ